MIGSQASQQLPVWLTNLCLASAHDDCSGGGGGRAEATPTRLNNARHGPETRRDAAERRRVCAAAAADLRAATNGAFSCSVSLDWIWSSYLASAAGARQRPNAIDATESERAPKELPQAAEWAHRLRNNWLALRRDATLLASARLVLLQSAVCGLGRCSVASERSTMANGASNSQASRAARHRSLRDSWRGCSRARPAGR